MNPYKLLLVIHDLRTRHDPRPLPLRQGLVPLECQSLLSQGTPATLLRCVKGQVTVDGGVVD